jgi:hypothetical protein
MQELPAMIKSHISSRSRTVAPAIAVLALVGSGGVAYALSGLPAGGDGSAARVSTPAGHQLVAPRRALVLSLSARTPHQTVLAGANAKYRLQITRACDSIRLCAQHGRRVAARVQLNAAQPMPDGLTASFWWGATRAPTSTLTVRTRKGTHAGTYRLRVQARLSGQLGTGYQLRRVASTTVILTVTSIPPITLVIAGSPARRLMPGGGVPLDLKLTNPRGSRLLVSRLTVTIARVSAPAADAVHPCTIKDFAVSQFSGAYGFALARSSTRSLTQLGTPPDRWPAVLMLDRAVNQDGCKGASITLSYGGAATRASR